MCTCIYLYDYSGLRRVLPTSRRASTGGHMLFVMWLTTMWITGSGLHLWNEGLQTASILRSSSQSGIARCFRAMLCHVKKLSACCTMSLMQQQENLHHGNQRAISLLVSMHCYCKHTSSCLYRPGSLMPIPELFPVCLSSCRFIIVICLQPIYLLVFPFLSMCSDLLTIL